MYRHDQGVPSGFVGFWILMFTLYNYYCSLVFSNLKQCFFEVLLLGYFECFTTGSKYSEKTRLALSSATHKFSYLSSHEHCWTAFMFTPYRQFAFPLFRFPKRLDCVKSVFFTKEFDCKAGHMIIFRDALPELNNFALPKAFSLFRS